MDAMDVLGALLGKKAQSGGSGGSILKDILGGGRSKAPPKSTPQPRRQHPQSRRPMTIDGAAKSLEELLNVSNDHHTSRRQAPRSQTTGSQSTGSQSRRTPEHEAMNEQSKVLARAMVNASKSDGQISKEEQESILKQLDHVSQEEINFLREEFAKPLDVKEFTWSVPRGLEEQVYIVSLLAIELDEQKEANYLADLAHGLRLDLRRCNEIHRQYRAPEIFKEN